MLLGKEFVPLIIKDYPYWTLVLNEKQNPYIGRCYAWWKDRHPGEGEGMRPDQIPLRALAILNKVIFTDVRRACTALGYKTEPYSKRFLLNMAYLANEKAHKHQLHYHFVPRQAEWLLFQPFGLRVEDTRWGAVFLPGTHQHILPPDQLEIIRLLMANTIG